jgi:hypothetical protein
VSRRGLSAAVAGAIVAGLVVASAVLADTVRIRTADQDAARLMVVQAIDLGSAAGWIGGPVKPTPPTPVKCTAFGPKRVPLVQTGSAESFWSRAGLQFDSQAQVLETARMVRADWQRTIVPPAVLPCLRTTFTSHLQKGERLVSFARVSFPKVGATTAAFRGVIDVRAQGRVRQLAIEIVLFTTGRATLDLTTTTTADAVEQVRPAEIALAQDMLGRAEEAAGIA